jgi:hypothetical protein
MAPHSCFSDSQMNSTSRLLSFRPMYLIANQSENVDISRAERGDIEPVSMARFSAFTPHPSGAEAAGDEVAANFKARLRLEIACQYMLAFRIAARL